MPFLPDHVCVYKKTAVFDRDSIPQGLLRNHSTKEGVWGRIQVLAGSLRYETTEPPSADYTPSTTSWVLRVGIPGVIAPRSLHRVAADFPGPLQFFVEFLK